MAASSLCIQLFFVRISYAKPTGALDTAIAVNRLKSVLVGNWNMTSGKVYKCIHA